MSRPDSEFDNFKWHRTRNFFMCIYLTKGLLFSSDDQDFLKEKIKSQDLPNGTKLTFYTFFFNLCICTSQWISRPQRLHKN